MFGDHQLEFASSNIMSQTMGAATKKAFAKAFVPVRQQQKTAEQRKHEEIYGNTVNTHGTGQRKDGSLMAGTADWRNLQQHYTNAPIRG